MQSMALYEKPEAELGGIDVLLHEINKGKHFLLGLFEAAHLRHALVIFRPSSGMDHVAHVVDR